MAAGVVAILSAVPASCQQPAPRTLVQWDFAETGNTEGWEAPGLSEFAAADGALLLVTRQAGEEVKSPLFNLRPALLQYIEVRLRATAGGIASFRWESTPRAGPPLPGRRNISGAPFVIVADRRYHEYRVLPFWHGAPDVRRLIFTPPEATALAIDWVRIVELELPSAPEPWWNFAERAAALGWRALGGVDRTATGPAGFSGRTSTAQPLLVSPTLSAWAKAYPWAAIRLRASESGRASLGWVADGRDGLRKQEFRVKGDDQFHTYNLDLSRHPDWRGKTILLTLEPLCLAGAHFELEFVRLAREPQGPAELEVTKLRLEQGERAERASYITCTVSNVGGETARNVRATVELPTGVKLRGRPTLVLREIPPRAAKQFIWQIEIPAGGPPVSGRVRITLVADNAIPVQIEAQL